MAPPKAALVQLSLLVVIAFMIFTTVHTDASPHHPVYTDASPHHPVYTDASPHHPVNTDASPHHLVNTDASPHHPVVVNSQVDFDYITDPLHTVHTDASPHHPVHRPPQQQMAIRGVVFCKPCNQKGINSLKGAKPLFKAVVKLHCNNTAKEKGLVETTQTDKKGHFVFTPKINVKQPKKMHQVIHNKCKVFLVSSPSNKKNVDDCSVPTNLHGGVSGAVVVPHHRRPHGHVTNSFNVRPLAFEPPKFCYTLGLGGE